MCYDKLTEINTMFYIAVESDLSSLGKHKGAHLTAPALLSKSMLIFLWLGESVTLGKKPSAEDRKELVLEFKSSLGTSKCLLIYNFSSPPPFFSFLESLGQTKGISSITVLEIYLCFPECF